ncbi:threonine synthase [Abiotrophia defectiva]|uniref:Threonine synthase n=1 Tax=Abiotrophia defectiva ATCC 49176 TaxID=592010 RepID=W1Q317_ABIDE|nr:threonine synthase [Abiotrophia defectiva]ESK65527.1 threonine synthase [Abiotrophia defectiva ATCC 49176]QKH47285.1 threonine synthase [Abiotrophia defectiva]
MTLYYQSTRNPENRVTASQAILKGIAEDGGLYVPEAHPKLPVPLADLVGKSYQEVAFTVMKAYFDDFSQEELQACIDGAYNSDKFDTPELTPVKKVGDAYYLELFHGQTIAFKDMALSILPYLMTTSAKKQGSDKEIVILTATSGDTGKAAMAGFADVPGTKIVVFYPKGGVSHIQELQMLTQKGDNTYVVGITSNFDDAQSQVKALFGDQALNEQIDAAGYQFSSANSINIGRLIPQVAYYVFAYLQLVSQGIIALGDAINVDVPTGNFGNILAAYYARQMGLPIKTFICASNKNNVLTDFFKTGVYDRQRPFYVTNSPSMDILISSNLERLIYHATGNDAAQTAAYMKQLVDQGHYQVTPQMQATYADFYGGYADEAQIEDSIKAVYEATGYVLDPHTAVATSVYCDYRQETGDTTPTLIASTASPYKFPRSVMQSFQDLDPEVDDLTLVDQLEAISGVPQPAAVLEVKEAQIRHNEVVDVAGMKASILAKLGL